MMCINVPIGYLSPEATCFNDFATPSEQAAVAHAAAVAQLLSLLFAGTKAGVYTGTPPEVTKARQEGSCGKEIDKLIAALSPLRQYMYDPHDPERGGADREDGDGGDGGDDGDDGRSGSAGTSGWRLVTFPQFNIVTEGLWNSKRDKMVGIRIWKLVADPSHSEACHFNQIMNENSMLMNNSHAGRLMVHQSKRPYLEHAKATRRLTCPSNLSSDSGGGAAFMHQSVDSVHKMMAGYMSYSNAFDGRGRSLWDKGDMPIGIPQTRLNEHEALGGTSPATPEVVLNPFWGKGRALSAGLLDPVTGSDIDIDPQQLDSKCYLDSDDCICFPEFAVKTESVFVCTDPSQNDIFTAPMPYQLSGDVSVGDSILGLYFREYGDHNRILRDAVDSYAREHGVDRDRVTCEDVKRVVETCVNGVRRSKDPDTWELERRVRLMSTVSADSIDIGPSDRALLESGSILITSKNQAQLSPHVI